MRDVKTQEPTVEEWLEVMAQTGGEGGCEATKVWDGGQMDVYDRKVLLDTGAGRLDGARLVDGDEVTDFSGR